MTATSRHLFLAHRPGHARGRRLSLLLGVIAMLLTVGTRLAAAPVEQSAPSPRLASVAAATPVPSAGSGCWVSGDLVGEANPASVGASLCTAP
jgi:hypothetical protein